MYSWPKVASSLLGCSMALILSACSGNREASPAHATDGGPPDSSVPHSYCTSAIEGGAPHSSRIQGPITIVTADSNSTLLPGDTMPFELWLFLPDGRLPGSRVMASLPLGNFGLLGQSTSRGSLDSAGESPILSDEPGNAFPSWTLRLMEPNMGAHVELTLMCPVLSPADPNAPERPGTYVSCARGIGQLCPSAPTATPHLLDPTVPVSPAMTELDIIATAPIDGNQLSGVVKTGQALVDARIFASRALVPNRDAIGISTLPRLFPPNEALTVELHARDVMGNDLSRMLSIPALVAEETLIDLDFDSTPPDGSIAASCGVHIAGGIASFCYDVAASYAGRVDQALLSLGPQPGTGAVEIRFHEAHSMPCTPIAAATNEAGLGERKPVLEDSVILAVPRTSGRLWIALEIASPPGIPGDPGYLPCIVRVEEIIPHAQ